MPFSDFAVGPTDRASAEQFAARRRGSAVHPSNTNAGYEVDVTAPYQPLPVRLDAVFPRATIRPFKPLSGQPGWFVVKLWVAPGQPMRGVSSLWVSKQCDTWEAAVQWAEHAVWIRRPQPADPATVAAAC